MSSSVLDHDLDGRLLNDAYFHPIRADSVSVNSQCSRYPEIRLHANRTILALSLRWRSRCASVRLTLAIPLRQSVRDAGVGKGARMGPTDAGVSISTIFLTYF